jgi:ESS family glutamate:Na+ symporter
MTFSAWWLLPLALPVLWLGEWLISHVPMLARFDLPVPIVGGLVVAGMLLLLNCLSKTPINFSTQVFTPAWTWLVEPETIWRTRPSVPVYLPFSTAFFTCVGLNASWSIAKRGGWQLILLLALATFIGVAQNVVGVGMCRAMHVNPIMGLICGSVTLMGGPSTALGMAHEFELAGFSGAGVVGASAAMFGIVAASLLAGWVGGQIIRAFRLQSEESLPETKTETRGTSARTTFLQRLGSPLLRGRTFFVHLFILLLCIKLGTWLSLGFNQIHFGNVHPKLPVYIGAMVVGLIVRNAVDATGSRLLSTAVINAIAGVALALFLAMAISSLNLIELRRVAGPMLAILSVNTIVTLALCGFLTFLLMGRDYDAAVTTAGHIGFALGITPNAIATMDVLEQKFGPSTEAVLIVTLVGGFLIDLTNSLIITAHLQFLK